MSWSSRKSISNTHSNERYACVRVCVYVLLNFTPQPLLMPRKHPLYQCDRRLHCVDKRKIYDCWESTVTKSSHSADGYILATARCTPVKISVRVKEVKERMDNITSRLKVNLTVYISRLLRWAESLIFLAVAPRCCCRSSCRAARPAPIPATGHSNEGICMLLDKLPIQHGVPQVWLPLMHSAALFNVKERDISYTEIIWQLFSFSQSRALISLVLISINTKRMCILSDVG